MQAIRIRTLGRQLGEAAEAAAATAENTDRLATAVAGMKWIGYAAGAILLWVAFCEARSRTR